MFVILKDKKWKDEEMGPGDQISLSENGWTDNKLCMEWMQECFEPATVSQLQGVF